MFTMRYILVSLVFFLTYGCQKQALYSDNRVVMGTFLEVTSSDKSALEIVFKEVSRLEKLLSKYDSSSEIAALNKTGSIKASPETFELVKKAKEFSEKTSGAFDVTVAPLVALWGFTDQKFRVPSKREIEKTLRLIGSDKIILDESKFVIKLKTRGSAIDLGGIAKGFAIDRAVRRLRELGVKSCLINLGGQVYGLGKKPVSGLAGLLGKKEEPWRVAVKDPRGEEYSGYIELVDKSASSSGDYEQFFLIDNKRYSHIIDPRSGYPAESGIRSVTIIAPEAATADALSTAVFVLGKEKGAELLKKFTDAEIKFISY